MSAVQALILGLLQGATELFPISSLGHSVLLPVALHWSYRPSDPTFVPFLVLLHLGTAGALLWIYRREWRVIVAGFVRAGLRGRIEQPAERVAMLLMVGTIPAGIAGVLFEHSVKALFANPRAAAAFLFLNGLMLLGAEALRRRRVGPRPGGSLKAEGEEAHQGDLFERVGALSFRQAVLVGSAQALALLPGVSRSGVTIGGGLLAGLDHQDATRYSFLLATPIIAAAGLIELPQLVVPGATYGLYLLGGSAAALAAYLSATFLVRYFRTGRLDPFAFYCLAVGAGAIVLLR